MVDAIESARQSVALVSYIFADDTAGHRFVEAMGRAVARGVEVRVLVDGVGVRYSWPLVHRSLRKLGVKAELFLPTITQAGLAFFNLRNHRKALIVDGRLAFTGGMNIWERCVLANNDPNAVRDLHFRVEGPVVGQIMEAFAEDWLFSTREVLDGPSWFPTLSHPGPSTARVITDGPDGDLEVTRTVLLGAIATARESVRIVTPYFLPDQAMIAALSVAALRGVKVQIVLPSQVNVPVIQWASTAQLWQLLRPGCRVFLTPMPFDHSKLTVVDGIWSLVGSTNWDPRSLRLNFELDVETYDPTFGAHLDAVVDAKIATAREITLAEVDARPLPIKVRDGIARLASPYL
jgi:cardiolipin synthase